MQYYYSSPIAQSHYYADVSNRPQVGLLVDFVYSIYLSPLADIVYQSIHRSTQSGEVGLLVP
jgi:hypothetical protein